MQFIYRLAADGMVILHAGYVLFVVLGFAAIVVGSVRKWQWIRNPWFRGLHLAAIVFVVAEAWLGVMCPLTVWEQQLREMAGQTAYRGDFIARWVHELLFFEVPTWVFTVCYTVFGLLVAAAFFIAPPRWPAGFGKRGG